MSVSLLYEFYFIKAAELYSANLTDKQWKVIQNIVNRQERKQKYYSGSLVG